MLILFALTIFVSSALLFLVQPMFAKMVLPLLGGSPSVWNTCVVFFQAVLLCGYVYAHVTTTWLRARWQARVHALVVIVPLILLPIAVRRGWTPPTDHNPTLWLLGLLFVSVGLPFFVVSTTAPLLQKWFSATGHRSAKDPYFLYAASNLGSLLALLSYPLLLEPLLRLRTQSVVWTVGYVTLVMLILACASVAYRRSAPSESPDGEHSGVTHTDARVATSDVNPPPTAGENAPIPWTRRLKWLVLSAAPSSLLLGVTTFLSTDIAAIPLLWIVPLVLYLLTFIVAFASPSDRLRTIVNRLFPITVLPLVLLLITQTAQPAVLVIPIHLLAFLVAALVCHLELANSRPAPQHLTEFYLYVSLGGLLGGLFNTLVAPLVFTRVLEYPIALVLACALRPAAPDATNRPASMLKSMLLVTAVTAFTLIIVLTASPRHLDPQIFLALLGVPLFLAFSLSRRPLPFAAAIAGTLAAGLFYPGFEGPVLYSERTFFGVSRVIERADGFRSLYHGTTLHGRESLDPALAHEPISYYHREGPIGRMFAALESQLRNGHVGVVGLGTGTLAAYASPGQRWTFYEIDPAVVRLARDSGYFSFLRNNKAEIQIVQGDARLSLKHAAPRDYNLLIMDAFSSDAIPMHLMSREALSLYRSKLADDGVIVFHISNRHLRLEHVLSRLAADEGLTTLVRSGAITRAEAARGIESSDWMVMAASRASFGALTSDKGWIESQAGLNTPLWTDDFSNIISALRH